MKNRQESGGDETKPIDLVFLLEEENEGREGGRKEEGACVNSTKSAWRGPEREREL